MVAEYFDCCCCCCCCCCDVVAAADTCSLPDAAVVRDRQTVAAVRTPFVADRGKCPSLGRRTWTWRPICSCSADPCTPSSGRKGDWCYSTAARSRARTCCMACWSARWAARAADSWDRPICRVFWRRRAPPARSAT